MPKEMPDEKVPAQGSQVHVGEVALTMSILHPARKASERAMITLAAHPAPPIGIP